MFFFNSLFEFYYFKIYGNLAGCEEDVKQMKVEILANFKKSLN
jgi:hypothetical protein